MLTDGPVTGCGSVSYCSGQTWKVCLHVLRLNPGNKLWNSDFLLWVNKSTCGTLVIISSLVIFAGCSHVVGQLPHYNTPTFSLLFPPSFCLCLWRPVKAMGIKAGSGITEGPQEGAREFDERRGAPLNSSQMAARHIHPAEERDEEESTNRRIHEEDWLETARSKWQRECVRIENKIKD